MKFPPRDLNLGSYPPPPTSTYTCKVITTQKICGGYEFVF